MTTGIGLQTTRDLLAAQVEELNEAGGYPEKGVVIGGSCRAARGLIAYIATAGEIELGEIQRQLNEAEDKHIADERRRAAERERDERRNQPWSEEDEVERNRILLDAARQAEDHGSTEQRLARIEALLGRIASGLEKRSH